MAKYCVTIDFSHPLAYHALHDIEQGGPIRHYTLGTLHEATAFRNLALFASGHAMRQGMRKMRVGQRDEHESGPIKTIIERIA